MTMLPVILAGGRGTRSADPGTAKLAQRIGGRSLLDWHLHLLAECGFTEAVIVTGHLSDQVRQLAGEVDTRGVDVHLLHEEHPSGTVGAVLLASETTPHDRFLVMLGDILVAAPLDHFGASWVASGKGVAVAVHPSTHPSDSDAVVPLADDRAIVIPKSQPRHHLPNMSSAGLFAVSRAALARWRDAGDIGSGVLPRAADDDDLYAYVSSHYFKDTGTPDRLFRASEDIASGAFRRRGTLAPRPALFLDRDGVLNPARPEVHDPDAFTLIPGVAQAVREANEAGIPVFVVTNQPGLAKGFFNPEVHLAIRARMDALLSREHAFVDDYAFCPHHPERGFPGERPELKVRCGCRKPEPGMLLALAAHHRIDLARSVLVGDTWRDEQAAAAAGAAFLGVRPIGERDPAEAIRMATTLIKC